MTFVWQETAVYALLSRKEPGHLLHHVPHRYQKEWKFNTNTLKVRNARKHIVELLLTEHRSDCTKCYKNQNCELQSLANEFAFGDTIFLDLVEDHKYNIDRSSPSFIKDDSKCIRCQRCVRTCSELQHVSAIAVANKGAHQKIILIS